MKHFLVLTLMTLGIIAQAQKKVFMDEDIDGNKYYIYPSTIRKTLNGLTVWGETVFMKPRLFSFINKYSKINKEQHLINCNEMKYALIVVKMYSKNGDIVYSDSKSEFEAHLKSKQAQPGTIPWHIIEETCRRYNQGDY